LRYCAYIPGYAETHRRRTLNAAQHRRYVTLRCALPSCDWNAVKVWRCRCGFAVVARLCRC